MYIVRHGETELNVIKAFQGHTDSALTARGKRQARENANRLKSAGCQQIISSDLPRAKHTAAIISEILNIPVQTDSNLREVWFGGWDGMADADIQQQFPDLWQQRIELKWQFNGYDGESYEAAHERARTWLSENYAHNQLIVCHRTFGKILRGAYAGLSPKGIMATDFLHAEIYRLNQNNVTQLA